MSTKKKIKKAAIPKTTIPNMQITIKDLQVIMAAGDMLGMRGTGPIVRALALTKAREITGSARVNGEANG
jgi:hypothetical protein